MVIQRPNEKTNSSVHSLGNVTSLPGSVCSWIRTLGSTPIDRYTLLQTAQIGS